MKLEDLKKKMSELERTLAKTDDDIKINVKASKAAQTKLLDRLRIVLVSGIAILVIIGILIVIGFMPSQWSLRLNIFCEVYGLIATIWYGFIYYKVRKLDIATLPPAKLISDTAQIRIMTLCGDLTLIIGFVMIMLCFGPTDGDGIWILTVCVGMGLYNMIRKHWPEYMTLFKEMNSIE